MDIECPTRIPLLDIKEEIDGVDLGRYLNPETIPSAGATNYCGKNMKHF